MLSGVAFLVMGNSFGFSNVTFFNLVPGFFVGGTMATIVSYLLQQNRKILLKRHEKELEAAVSLQKVMAGKIEAEKAARASQAQLAEIFTIAPEAIITTDSTGIIKLFNKSAERIFGYSAEYVRGKSIKMLMPERFRQTYRSFIKIYDYTIESNPSDNLGNEVIGLHKNGTEFPALSSVSKTRIDGEIIYTSMFRDMTKDRELEEQIRRSQKMDAIGQLTAGIAHDFNNILGIAMGNLELLKELNDEEKILRYVDPALRAIDRGTDITKKLLGVSRNDVTKIRICSVNEVIRDLKILIAKSLTASIRVDFDLSDDIWNVAIDPGDLEDALINLSLNARDAMPDGGTLTIKTENKTLDSNYVRRNAESREGDFVMISIADTGSGMKRKVKEKILEPFFSTKETGKGTGLGLSMVYGFVKRLGGHLEISSEVNKGSVFSLYLPRVSKRPDGLEHMNGDGRNTSAGSGAETTSLVDNE